MERSPKIIFEDSQILVLEKPAGLIVTRAETLKSPTLQDWLAEFLNLGGNWGIGARAGIVHRLDKDTSGIILVGKTEKSFKFLQEQFAKREVVKKYLALVHGIPTQNSFEINLPIARQRFGKFGVKVWGKIAKTTFLVLKKFQFGEKFDEIAKNFPKKLRGYFENHAKFYSLLEAEPLTGRTHQIRVHLKSVNLFIVSDPLYLPGKLVKFDANFCPRLFLHAKTITFAHPTKKIRLTFETKLPKDLIEALQYLKENS